MIKLLRYFSYFGGIAITLIGIIIMLIEGDTGEAPEHLIIFTLALVFLVGVSVILYLLKNKGL